MMTIHIYNKPLLQYLVSLSYTQIYLHQSIVLDQIIAVVPQNVFAALQYSFRAIQHFIASTHQTFAAQQKLNVLVQQTICLTKLKCTNSSVYSTATNQFCISAAYNCKLTHNTAPVTQTGVLMQQILVLLQNVFVLFPQRFARLQNHFVVIQNKNKCFQNSTVIHNHSPPCIK